MVIDATNYESEQDPERVDGQKTSELSQKVVQKIRKNEDLPTKSH